MYKSVMSANSQTLTAPDSSDEESDDGDNFGEQTIQAEQVLPPADVSHE